MASHEQLPAPAPISNTSQLTLITRKEARAAGLLRFFTGEPCRYGHICERYVHRYRCVECERQRRRASYAANPEPAKAAAKSRRDSMPEKVASERKAYYEKNRAKISARYAAIYAANPEPAKAQVKQWRKKNPERHRALVRKYYWENPAASRARNRAHYLANRDAILEVCKAYRRANRHLVLVYSRNARARRRAAKGRHSARDIAWLLKTQGGKCAHPWCRARLTKGYHCDHIIPLVLGGSNDRKNLQLLCQRCNLSKGAKHPIDFALQNGALV